MLTFKKTFGDLEPGEKIYFIKINGNQSISVINEDVIKSITPAELSPKMRRVLPPGNYVKIEAYKESEKVYHLVLEKSILPTYTLIFPAKESFVHTARGTTVSVYSTSKEKLSKWLIR